MRWPAGIRLIVAGFCAAVSLGSAAAQDGASSRPITLIVPFPAGGSTDMIARVVAEAMRAPLGEPLEIDNRGGAAGSVGTLALVRAAPDGTPIGMGTASTLTINPLLYKALTFDVIEDIAPVGLIAKVPNVLVVNAKVAANTVADLVALAEAQPGKLAYASAGNGSVSHLMAEQFKVATGTDIVHVPYRGMVFALADVLNGGIDMMFDNLPSALPFIKSGRMRALAVSSPQRLAALPDVPTFAELGLTGLDWMAFFGLIAPGKTPQPVIDKLNAALAQALADPKVRETLSDQQAEPQPGSPGDFAALIYRQLERMKRAVAATKLEL